MVDYKYTSVDVGASADTGVAIELKNGGKVVATTILPDVPLDATTTLMVGTNNLYLKASAAGNDQTYTVKVKRNEPEPTLQFTLLDSDGGVISSGDHLLKLAGQSRSYNLVSVQGITDDHLLVATSIQMSVMPFENLMGETDLGRSGVKVSINGVTVPGVGSHISVDLSEGTNTLAFDVNYETGDPSDPMDISTHRVRVERKGNSVPMFPANHSLSGRDIVVVQNELIEPTRELPFATGGNGDLSYELKGDEALGTGALPATLYELPTGRSINGELKTAPPLIGTGDVSYYYLVLSVADSDAITGASDEDTLRFTIKVVRDESLLPDTTTTPRAKGDLLDLRVLYVSSSTAAQF